MQKTKEPRLGKLAPKYSFMMNPYPEFRFTSCPCCQHKTGQRKVPLLIHVAPMHFVALNYICRYCPHCDLLLAHKHQVEHLLYAMFGQVNPQAISNDYLVLGTVEKAAWREGVKQPKTTEEMLAHVHDFKCYYSELRMTRRGWYPKGQTPPVMEPPASREWVKNPDGGWVSLAA